MGHVSAQLYVSPWRDLEGYVRLRLEGAVTEAELALKFLDQGLHRNAAGKAFQGWKALLAFSAVEFKHQLAKLRALLGEASNGWNA